MTFFIHICIFLQLNTQCLLLIIIINYFIYNYIMKDTYQYNVIFQKQLQP